MSLKLALLKISNLKLLVMWNKILIMRVDNLGLELPNPLYNIPLMLQVFRPYRATLQPSETWPLHILSPLRATFQTNFFSFLLLQVPNTLMNSSIPIKWEKSNPLWQMSYINAQRRLPNSILSLIDLKL